MVDIATSNYSSRYGARVIWVAIHTTEGIMDANDLGYYWQRINNASSHAGCDNLKTRTYVNPDYASWTLLNGNSRSVNMEICGWARWSRDEWLGPQRGRLIQAANWARQMCDRFGIPKRHIGAQGVARGEAGIIGHVDYTNGARDGSHWDPGPGFPWDVFIDMVNGGAGAPGGGTGGGGGAPVTGPATTFPLPRNEYFGLITGPNESHGGFNAQEQVWVKQIQQALQAKGFAPNVPGWADGIFEQPTKDAVAAWQRAHMPGTTRFGEVWWDDWEVLIQGKSGSNPTPAPTPTPPPSNIPAFPLPQNHYFGLITGPNESHGGYYENERQWVKLIQQALQRKGFAPNYPGWADGIYEQPTKDAVAAWQRAAMPGTTRFGEVWWDDWAQLLK